MDLVQLLADLSSRLAMGDSMAVNRFRQQRDIEAGIIKTMGSVRKLVSNDAGAHLRAKCI